MLPKFLYGSYKRYKADTETFTEWLVGAATKHGYEPSFAGSEAPRPAKKAKGKATKTQAAVEEQRFKVDLREFIPMAQIVAGSGSKVDIPASIIALVKKAISLRKNHTRWFQGKNAKDVKNKSHSHFVSVLEKVCALLESPACETNEEPVRTAASEMTALMAFEDGELKDEEQMVEGLLGQFNALEIEKPSTSASHSSHQQKKAKSTVAIQYEIDESQVDEADHFGLTFFAAYCLFEDLNNIRAFIKQTWAEYHHGTLDLMSAALTTDAAVQLVRQLIDEYMAIRPLAKDGWKLQCAMMEAACTARGRNPGPMTPLDVLMPDVFDWVFGYPTLVLQAFAEVLQPGHAPAYKKGHFGIYDSRRDREAMTAEDKVQEDRIILCEILPDFAILAKCRMELEAEDEITKGLMEYVRTKKIALWVSFAVQIFLDVHHAQRHSKAKPFNDLRLAALRIKKTIEAHWKLAATMPKPKFWPAEGDEFIQSITSTVDTWVLKDPFFEARKKRRAPGQDAMEPHAFLRQHPILCGLTMLNLQMRMQTIGIQLINQWFDVVEMAYLYNMMLQSTGGQLTISWPDMDAFIALSGEDRLFYGEKPDTIEKSYKRLQMVTGISSAKNFARDARTSGHILRREGPNGKERNLEEPTPTANLFRLYYTQGGRSKLGLDNIDTLLDELSAGNTIATASASKTARSLIRTKWARSHTINVLQLLVTIKEELFSEEPKLLFNYFGMHMRCIEMLRLIKSDQHHKFVQYFGSGYLPDDTYLANLVLLIHHVAAGSAEAARQLGLTGSGHATGSRFVVACASVLKPYLEKHGSKAVQEVRAFARNKSLVDVPKLREQSKEMYWTLLEELVDAKSLASFTTGIGWDDRSGR